MLNGLARQMPNMAASIQGQRGAIVTILSGMFDLRRQICLSAIIGHYHVPLERRVLYIVDLCTSSSYQSKDFY